MTTDHIVLLMVVVFGGAFIYRCLTISRPEPKPSFDIEGFDPVVQYDGITGSLKVALDPASNRFALSGNGATPCVYDFRQLVAVDVERNGATVTTTKGSNGLAGAAVGVALIGPAGLLLGGGTRSRGITTPTITKLSMKIYVNDLIKPGHEVVFYRNRQGGSASGIIVSNAARQMDEWYGRFRTILAMQSNAGERLVPDASAPTIAGSPSILANP